MGSTAVILAAVPNRASDLLIASSWTHVALCALRGLRLGILLFFLIFLVERHYKVSTSQYKSRNFLHDICYWFYSRSDLHRLLFTASLFSLLASRFHLIQIASFQAVPAPARWVVYFIVSDFFAYWIHRLQHAVGFLWAFHSVHHAPEQLTFATSTRFHPIDNFITNTLAFIPLIALGQPVNAWLPVYYAVEFLIAIEHSEIPWRFGPLYRVVVSPTFHSFHRSIHPGHHNRNFGRMLSVWDYLFGTAVSELERPRAYGLAEGRMPTLVSQLLMPFACVFAEAQKAIRAPSDSTQDRVSS